MASDFIEELCQSNAEKMVESMIDYMWSSAVNAGQEALIANIEDDLMDQVDPIANGEYEPLETDHPEAIGEIVETVNDFCNQTAEVNAMMLEADALLF